VTGTAEQDGPALLESVFAIIVQIPFGPTNSPTRQPQRHKWILAQKPDAWSGTAWMVSTGCAYQIGWRS